MAEAILIFPGRSRKNLFCCFVRGEKKYKENKNLVPYKRGTEENVFFFFSFSDTC